MVHTMHTMARVKNELRGDGHATEPDVRERGEAEIVAAADILTANTSDEAAELQRHYGARPSRSRWCPRESTCTPSIPATSPSRGPSSGWPRTPR